MTEYRVCVAVTGRTLDEVAEMVRFAEDKGADLIEIRLDYMREGADLDFMRKLTRLPLIATLRIPSEGGFFQGDYEKRSIIFLEAARAGFDYVDLELRAPRASEIAGELREKGAGIIISFHTSDRPSLRGMSRIFNMEKRLKPDICKIIPTAITIDDNLTCLEFVAKASKSAEIVCFCMGPLGIVSRVLSPLFGGAFTYAAVEKGRESAPGQITLSEIRKAIEIFGV
jgi:3-dehydroquinate dehydratase type I